MDWRGGGRGIGIDWREGGREVGRDWREGKRDGLEGGIGRREGLKGVKEGGNLGDL